MKAYSAPGVPSIWAPSSNTTGYYSISWSAGSGETPDSYVVIGEGLSGGVYSGPATSSSRGPLDSGTYYYRVKACKNGVCSGFSSVVSTRVTRQYPPGTPSISSPSTSSNGYFTVSWSAGSGASPNYYEVIGENLSGYVYSGGGTSSSRGPLADGTYYYRVRACNSAGCSSYSPTTSTTVSKPKIPNTPSISSPHTNDTGYFTVTWSAASGPQATRYEVIGEGASGTISDNMSTSSNRGPLTNGTYYYRVRACNSYGCSAYSPTTSTTVELPPLPGKPQLTVPTLSETGSYQISWQADTQGGVPARYEVVGEGQSGNLYTGSATTLSRSGIREGDHYYKVRGCNISGCGDYSDIKGIKVRLPITLPSFIKAEQEGRGVLVSWQKVDSAVSYMLQVKFNSTEWQNYKEVAQPSGSTASYQLNNLNDGVRAFRVSVCTAFHCSEQFTPASNIVVIAPPAIPTLTVPSSSTTGNYIVNWLSRSGTKPITYQLIGEQQEDYLYVGEGTSLVRQNLPEDDYYYRVKACNSVGCAESSVASINVRLPLALPNYIQAQQQENNIEVSWQKVSSASSYTLQVKFNNRDWQEVIKVPQPSEGDVVKHQFTGLLDGARVFRVTSCSALRCMSTYTAASNSVVINTPTPGMPSKPAATTVADTVTLTWPRVAWASYYKAQVQFNAFPAKYFAGNTVSQVSQDKSTVSLQLVGLNAGTRVFTVQACNLYDQCSSFSAPSNQSVVQASVPEVPEKPTILVKGNDIEVTWAKAPYATSYNVQVKYGSGNWTLVSAGTGVVQPFREALASVTFYNLSNGSRQFRVRGINDLGESEYSAASDVVVVFAPENKGDELIWEQVSGATSFVIESVLCAENCEELPTLNWQPVVTLPGSSRSYAIKPVENKIYRIKACLGNSTCSQWIYIVKSSPKKRIIFIHTDLLGSPVAESVLNEY
ncbi:hypothetical protein EXT48_09865 [Pseudoalteromonas sp. CO348]|uniref:hypothetical protein n=1 Tax=Pseudoalteromonas sp. CO348 TaxID=1777271 RepID=UPI001023D6FD|nr:hypothetical protein [Pseudoalteromonas sp. CO348]RZG05099.1 hypothetical protein EXT48_09865 [Pseudoalteromonas sp. CO348]